MAKKKDDWIQGAVKKPGALRSELGVKPGLTIPPQALLKAAGVEGERARLT